MPKNSQFIPPALPPKRNKISSSNTSLNSITTPPTSPKISNDDVFVDNIQSNATVEARQSLAHQTSQSEGIQNFSKKDEAENETVVLRKKASGMVFSNYY